MKRTGKIALWMDALAFFVLFVFLLDNYLAVRTESAVWGEVDNLGWVRHPVSSITWPPFWGNRYSIPEIFVGGALIGCIVSFLILFRFFAAWIFSEGKGILLRRRTKAL